jgi:hypothetical protein
VHRMANAAAIALNVLVACMLISSLAASVPDSHGRRTRGAAARDVASR